MYIREVDCAKANDVFCSTVAEKRITLSMRSQGVLFLRSFCYESNRVKQA